jgi:DNA-binding GntR family transcriptional regulator
MTKPMPLAPDGVEESLRGLTINRTSPVPLYFQVAQHLEHAISSGSIPPGTRFDNEIVLAERLGLSRPTMRRAMQHLVDKGLIVRRRGIGTRVVQPKVRRPLELTSLYDDLAGSGQSPTTKLLSFDTVPADATAAEKLAVDEGTPVVRIERLRSASDLPIARMTNYLPERIVTFSPDELERRGLYEMLRAQGVHLHSAVQTVGARTATATEARLLGEPRGAAVLTMQRVSFDDRGNSVEWGDHLYVASRYSFEINLLTA